MSTVTVLKFIKSLFSFIRIRCIKRFQYWIKFIDEKSIQIFFPLSFLALIILFFLTFIFFYNPKVFFLYVIISFNLKHKKNAFLSFGQNEKKIKLPFQGIQMQRVQDLHKMSQLLREMIIFTFIHSYLCPDLKGKKVIPVLQTKYSVSIRIQANED